MTHEVIDRWNKCSSSYLWGVAWENHFPKLLPNQNILVQKSTYEECSNFAQNNFHEIYKTSDDNRFLWLEACDSREKYYNINADFFSFKEEAQMIGMFVGNPLDWETYYLRNVSLNSSYHGKKLFSEFLKYLLDQLSKYEIHRVQTEVSPSNIHVVSLLTKLGFKTTGVNLSERWGAIVSLTKFLSNKHQSVFDRQFCHHIER